jgi:hypothetical protein
MKKTKQSLAFFLLSSIKQQDMLPVHQKSILISGLKMIMTATFEMTDSGFFKLKIETRLQPGRTSY